MMSFNLVELGRKKRTELQAIAKGLGIKNVDDLSKFLLIRKIYLTQRGSSRFDFRKYVYAWGHFVPHPKGGGFLRPDLDSEPDPDDVYIDQYRLNHYQIQRGDFVAGWVEKTYTA